MALKWCVVLVWMAAAANSELARQSDAAKAELEKYIASKSLEMNPRYRQHYHVSPPVGWMNDPNGFSYYKGRYHIFYQYYPYASEWGPMHWGHSSSTNLVDWITHPTALLPDEEQCFSGSGIVNGSTLYLMYTGHEIIAQDPGYKESQYLAYSTDGVTFTKDSSNPVLLAAPNNSPDFRDPKVWKYGNYYYVIIGSKTDDMQKGRVLLYRSTDLKTWQYLRVLGETGVTGDFGYMWECPDFFEMGGKYVLLWSPQGMVAQGDRYKNIYQTGYLIGSFNYTTFEFIPETSFKELDFGHDFYASQTVDNNGTRYQVAWFNTWEKVHPEAEDGWAGTLTLFRRLELNGTTLLMKPVDGMVSLRENKVHDGTLSPNQVLNFGQTGEAIINANLSLRIDILLQGSSGGNNVWLRWNPAVGKVVVNRDGDVRQVEWTPIGSRQWRLFLDASSIELFCGEGEVVFSSRAYPNGTWDLINLSPQSLSIVGYTLKRSVPDITPRNFDVQHKASAMFVGIAYLFLKKFLL